MKKCKSCLIEKELEMFYNRSDRPNSKRSICVECHLERRKRLYRQQAKKTEFRINHAKQTSRWRKENIEKNIYSRAKNRAKYKKIDFDLSIEDIIIPEMCPILGIQLEIADGIASDNSPSLDRMDNSKGYTKENIIICSYRANRIKNDSTFFDIEKLYEWYKKKEANNAKRE